MTQSPNPQSKIFPIQRYDDEIVKPTVEKIIALGVQKGGEYAGDVDRLANFRRNAAAWGVTMEQCWGIYTSKHWDAIKQYVEDLAQGKSRVRAEPLDGRVDDMIVYLLLFKAMLLEHRDAEVVGRPFMMKKAEPGEFETYDLDTRDLDLTELSTSFRPRTNDDQQ